MIKFRAKRRKGSILGKLIGSYVIFSLTAILLAFAGLFVFIIFSFNGRSLQNFPGLAVNTDGSIDHIETVYNLGGWVEELDTDYKVTKVHGKKLTKNQSYTPEQLLAMTELDSEDQAYSYDNGALISVTETNAEESTDNYFVFWQKKEAGYYLIFYPSDAFNLIYSLNLDKVIISNVNSRESLIIFLLILVDVFAVSFYIFRKIKRPLDSLIDGMKRVEQGEEQVELSMQTEREFVEIGQAFNRMTEQLHIQKAENEKMAKNRQKMLLELSHDIKTPVATIKSCACALLEGMVPEEELLRYYRAIALKAERVNTMSEDFFTMLKMESADYRLELKEVNLAEFTRRICAEYYGEITEAGFNFEIDIPEEPILIQGDEKQLTRVIGNLLTNAKKYNQDGKEIQILLKKQENITLQIKDDGSEIAPQIQATMFTAFVRGESARNSMGGTGLGLAIARAVMEKHGGSISYKREDGWNVFELKIRQPSIST